MSVTRVFRIEHEGAVRYAAESNGGYRLVEGDPGELDTLKRRAEAAARGGTPVTPSRILSPVAPSKVVAIGLNYKDHAAEMNKPLPAEPLMFLKPSTAVVGPGDDIRIPAKRRPRRPRSRARGHHRQTCRRACRPNAPWTTCSG